LLAGVAAFVSIIGAALAVAAEKRIASADSDYPSGAIAWRQPSSLEQRMKTPGQDDRAI
jgi:hypothetical protein